MQCFTDVPLFPLVSRSAAASFASFTRSSISCRYTKKRDDAKEKDRKKGGGGKEGGEREGQRASVGRAGGREVWGENNERQRKRSVSLDRYHLDKCTYTHRSSVAHPHAHVQMT